MRAKVHALRVGSWNDDAARYFRFAQRFSQLLGIGWCEAQGQPSLVLALQRESGVELQGLADRRAPLVELSESRVGGRLVQPVRRHPLSVGDPVQGRKSILISMSKEIRHGQTRRFLSVIGIQSV